MKQKHIFYIVILSVLVFGLPAQLLAQAQIRERLNIPGIEIQRQKIEEKRDLLVEQWPLKDSNIEVSLPQQIQLKENIKDQFQEQKEAFKGYMVDLREDLTSQAKDEIRARQRQLMEESRKQIKNYKEEMNLRIQEMKIEKAGDAISYKEELREKLQGVLSEEKIDQSEKFSDKVNRLNEVYSERYSGRLSAFETVLDKMELRAERMEIAGKDISEALICISAARQTILNAYENILSQRTKIYKVEIEEGEAPGLAFQTILRELKDDHRELRESVMKPVIDSLRECLNVLKETRVQTPEEEVEEEDEVVEEGGEEEEEVEEE